MDDRHPFNLNHPPSSRRRRCAFLFLSPAPRRLFAPAPALGLWFTRAEYEEYGAGYIHSKFAA